MNRKLSGLPRAQQIAGNLGYRLPSAFDQEREEFEKTQNNAVTKALSFAEAPPKEKHVRTLILGTYQNRGTEIFWKKLRDEVPLFGQEIVAWKFCIVLHRIMQDGAAKVLTDSISQCSLLDQVFRSHDDVHTSSYGKLIGQYGKMIIDKLVFHNKNKNVPANFSMKHAELENIDAGDMFEMGVDLLDQMENTGKVMQSIFDSFEVGNKSVSLTTEGQCRMASLIPCTNDTTRLLELTANLMRLLHTAVPWDALEGHRKRFGEIHVRLRKLYDKMTNYIYLREMVQIPRLSEDLTMFLQTLKRISEAEEAKKPVKEDIFSSQPPAPEDELISVAGEAYDTSMAYIQQEYSDLSSKYQMVLQMLESEQGQRAKVQEECLVRERQLEEQLEALRKQFAEISNVAEAANSAAATSSDADGKLEKLKAVYQKLRNDHIGVLRQKGDADKKVQSLKSTVEALESRAKSHREKLLGFFEKHNVDFSKATRAEAKEEDTLGVALDTISEKLDTLQMSLLSRENALRALEEVKMKADSEETMALKGLLTSKEAENAELEKRSSQLGEANDDLRASLDRCRQSWYDEINWRRRQLNSSLVKSEEHEGIFTCCWEELEGNLLHEQALASTSHDLCLPAHDRLMSITMLAMAHFLPFAGNTEGLNLEKICQLAEAVTASSDASQILTTWPLFKDEVRKQMVITAKSLEQRPSSDVDGEIRRMQASISEAAATMEKLMNAARANETKKKNIDVDLKILDSCSGLIQAIELLIKAARELQSEITSEAGTVPKDFYRRNQKWSQGLISAAKDIGSGAKCLVDAADGVMAGRAKFEELIAASQEITASTAQMVMASRVKARQDSVKLEQLSGKSRTVAEATAKVIATCRACASQLEESENEIDLMALTFHQSKRLEMEVQIKVLELETQLEKQRNKLFAIRKHQYAKNAKKAEDEKEEVENET